MSESVRRIRTPGGSTNNWRRCAKKFLPMRRPVSPKIVRHDSMSRMILQIMGAVAEFERSLILERQREGIALAKKEGKYKGRKPLPAHIVAAIREKTALGVPCARIARELHIGESSVRRYRSAVTP